MRYKLARDAVVQICLSADGAGGNKYEDQMLRE